MRQHINYLIKTERLITLLEIAIALVGVTGSFIAVLEVI